jgi:hypothetical protein
VRPSAASQQYAPSPHHQNTHSDLWSSIRHLHLYGSFIRCAGSVFPI